MRIEKYISSDYHYCDKNFQIESTGSDILSLEELEEISVRINIRSELSEEDLTYIC